MKKIFFIAVLCFQLQAMLAQGPAITVTKFRDSAESSAWCPYDTTLVAYNLLQSNGYYGIFFANVGPTNNMVNELCFTCTNASLPGKNYAQPAFDPRGRYVLFTAEKAVHTGNSANSIPGIGAYNDLWVMTTNGSKAYRLTTFPDTGLSAIIEPYFSPNGKEVMWAQMTAPVNITNGKQQFGYWVIKIAPFIDDTVNGPHLDSNHIRTIEPGATPAFNEPYGWSPDGKRIIFASDYNQFWVWDDQIYTSDTNGNNIEQMSSTAHSYPYTEHAFYSADGGHILWMTDLDANVGPSKGGDDWWIMNSDTTRQQRLTYFNDTLCPYWTGNIHINGHGSFCPTNTKFLGDVGGSQPVQVNAALSVGANYIIGMSYLSGVNNISDNPVKLSLYPNPAGTWVTINMPDNNEQVNYSIYNMLGNKVAEGRFYGKIYTLNISALADGLYLLNTYSGNSKTSVKFAVEKK